MSFKPACAKIVLTAVLGVSVMINSASAQGQLNMICCASTPTCDAVVANFSQKTGIDVNMIRMSAGEAYAKIRAEARNPKTDIWFSGTNEPLYQAASENLTISYKTSQFDNLAPQAQKMAHDTDNKATAYAMGIIGFVWNKEVLAAKNLPEPTSWADLLKPEYKGEIALSNPNTAGTGYSILVTLVDLMGEDGAFDYLKELNANVAAYSKGGSAAGSQAARGEVSIGIVFLHDAHILMKQGFPLKAVHPSEGTGYTMFGVSVVRGVKNQDAAHAFVDWILSAEGQNLVVEDAHVYPTAKNANFSEYAIPVEEVKLLNLDQKLYGSPKMRKQLLSRWDREIGAAAGQ